MADLILGARATIKGTGNSTYDGKKCEVLGVLASGRRLVAIDGYSTSSGLRMYLPANLEPLVAAPPPPPPSRFPTVVFRDDFSGPNIDTSKWYLYKGDGHNGNGLRDPAMWKIRTDVPGATSALVCEAWWDASIREMRAGGISCLAGHQRRGRWEVRAKCDADPSGVTAVNMLLLWPKGEGSAVVSTRGEINAFESSGWGNAARKPMHSYHHYGANLQDRFEHSGVSGLDWHVIAVEWDEAGIRYYRNGAQVWQVTDPTKMPPAEMVLTMQLDAVKNEDCLGARHLYIDYAEIRK